MVLALIAVVVGLLIGLATGGTTAALETVRPRFWWAPLAAAVLYVIPILVDDLGGEAVLAAGSLGVLLAATLANPQIAGLGVIAVGLALNLVPLAVDGATTVGIDAAATVELDTTEDLGVARRLEIPEDRVGLLGDRIPIPGLDWLVSFGDLVIVVGLVDVGLRLTRRRPAEASVPAPVAAAPPPPVDTGVADEEHPWFALVRDDRGAEPTAPPRPEPVPVPHTTGEIRLAEAERSADRDVVPYVDTSASRADELDLSLVRWADEPAPDEAETDELDLRDLQSLLDRRDRTEPAPPPPPEATGPIPAPIAAATDAPSPEPAARPGESPSPPAAGGFDAALAKFDRENDVADL
ncbi:MAG: DUF5317 family protein, partial [Actinomycetota bacterium]